VGRASRGYESSAVTITSARCIHKALVIVLRSIHVAGRRPAPLECSSVTSVCSVLNNSAIPAIPAFLIWDQLLDAFDHEHFDWSLGRLQLETELLLNRRDEGRRVRIRRR
jgi:hypothetical protein